jgi:pimeloyl-ACP methyl ester carboxylesterase
MRACVRVVMDAAGVERAAIMGISEAGSLTSLFAATHPGRCQALILYGAFAAAALTDRSVNASRIIWTTVPNGASIAAIDSLNLID